MSTCAPARNSKYIFNDVIGNAVYWEICHGHLTWNLQKKAALPLAENVFRITYWNQLKLKISKTIVILFDFQKKIIQQSAEIFGCLKLILVKKHACSKNAWQRFFALNSLIGLKRRFPKIFSWVLFGSIQVWWLISSKRRKGNNRNGAKKKLTRRTRQ